MASPDISAPRNRLQELAFQHQRRTVTPWGTAWDPRQVLSASALERRQRTANHSTDRSSTRALIMSAAASADSVHLHSAHSRATFRTRKPEPRSCKAGRLCPPGGSAPPLREQPQSLRPAARSNAAINLVAVVPQGMALRDELLLAAAMLLIAAERIDRV